MKPGSVLVDIAVDQGGCFEDTHPTTHADPTYPVHSSIFYCVANMPGAVPNTSTYALTNATMPYAVALADKGWQQACRDDQCLALGLNTHAGQLTNAPVGEAVGIEALSVEERWLSRAAVTGRSRSGRPDLPRPPRDRARAGGEHPDVVPARPASLPQFLAGRGIDDLDRVDEATVTAFLVALREGDADHPPLLDVSGAHRGGRTRVPQVRGDRRAGRGRPGGRRKASAPAKRLPKALPLADVEAILDGRGLGRTTLSMRDRALLELLYGTGARISEAVGLDVDDLDTGDRTVLLRGKGGKERIVPVGSSAVDAVSDYLIRARPDLLAAGKGTPALFLNARGGRLSRQSAWAVLVKAAERAGVTTDVARTRCGTVRQPPARRRRRCACCPGTSRPRLCDDHAGLTLVTVDTLREVSATAHPRARD